jgi:large subunit ribosomal protein L33
MACETSWHTVASRLAGEFDEGGFQRRRRGELARLQLICTAIREEEVSIMRVNITLACTECRNRNYAQTKNKRKHPDRLELRKYCPRCNAHTVHRETK